MEKANRSPLWAYVLPFGIFILGLALVSLVRNLAGESTHILLSRPEFWVYPMQTLACAVTLVVFWKHYEFRFSKGLVYAVIAGVLSLLVWISPQVIFGMAPRTDGFNPDLLAANPLYYWSTVVMRFVRLVIIVPLVEEIFWRGFLMRYLIRERFEEVPFGEYQAMAFWVVAVMFGLEHYGPDLVPGILTGVLFNFVAVKTRSLGACVIAHAITNFLLGWYIMTTKQWGFW